MAKTYQYDVAFSFAGEDRPYVEAVATHLRDSGVSVFYDAFEEIGLWGKDLYSHLDDIYRNKARYCVMFISQAYRRKLWTNHERESAQARAFQENEDYILPARFDDTAIPGVCPTRSYIHLRDLGPKEFAQKIMQKLGRLNLFRGSKVRAGSSNPIFRKKTANLSKQKLGRPSPARNSKVRAGSSPLTKTVNLNIEGIGKLPNDEPVVYKILTEAGKNNYTGVSKKGDVHAQLLKHLPGGKNYVPGSKIQVERMSSIIEARKKATRIIARTEPKYNQKGK